MITFSLKRIAVGATVGLSAVFSYTSDLVAQKTFEPSLLVGEWSEAGQCNSSRQVFTSDGRYRWIENQRGKWTTRFQGVYTIEEGNTVAIAETGKPVENGLQVSSLTQTLLSAKLVNEGDEKERPVVTYTRCSVAEVSPASPSTAATPKPSGVQPSQTNSTSVSNTSLATQPVGTAKCSGIQGDNANTRPIQKATLEPRAGGYNLRLTEIKQGTPVESLLELNNQLQVQSARTLGSQGGEWKSVVFRGTPVAIQPTGAFSINMMVSSRSVCDFSGTLQFVGNAQAQLFPGSSTPAIATLPSDKPPVQPVAPQSRRLVSSRCQNDRQGEKCGEVYLLGKRVLYQAQSDGKVQTLYEVEVEKNTPEVKNQKGVEWVNCSIREPFTAFTLQEEPDKLFINSLNPGASQVPNVVISSHAMYWAVCHDEFQPISTLTGKARSLGYPLNLKEGQQGLSKAEFMAAMAAISEILSTESSSTKRLQSSSPKPESPSTSGNSTPHQPSPQPQASPQPGKGFPLTQPAKWLGGAPGEGGKWFPNAKSACLSFAKSEANLKDIQPRYHYDDPSQGLAGAKCYFGNTWEQTDIHCPYAAGIGPYKYVGDLNDGICVLPTWTSVLPDCPCTEKEIQKSPLFQNEVYVNPFLQVPPRLLSKLPIPYRVGGAVLSGVIKAYPLLYYKFIIKPHHPEAASSYRSVDPKSDGPLKPGQQCTYDVEGNLITDGAGAGTPDLYSPNSNFIGYSRSHLRLDTKPFEDMDKNWRRYHEFWPPNKGRDPNGNICKYNKVPSDG